MVAVGNNGFIIVIIIIIIILIIIVAISHDLVVCLIMSSNLKMLCILAFIY